MPGVITETAGVPEVLMALAGTVARNCWLLTKAVGSALPLNITTEFTRKLLPVTLRVNCKPPAVALLGAIAVTEGFKQPEIWTTALQPSAAASGSSSQRRAREVRGR